jgi:membrane-associated two-gene conflict system component 1 (EACC1)
VLPRSTIRRRSRPSPPDEMGAASDLLMALHPADAAAFVAAAGAYVQMKRRKLRVIVKKGKGKEIAIEADWSGEAPPEINAAIDFLRDCGS